ncbi:hypothetical protein G6F65_021025 [Rhizopus arrhizus]|nr:hypothetical protein G6F65_021025 [Rhizopus arrhizus]
MACPLDCGGNQRGQLLALVVAHLGFAQHFRCKADRGEEVVEVVRDAAGKASQGFELLRMVQCIVRGIDVFLGLFLVRDVAGDLGKAKQNFRPLL